MKGYHRELGRVHDYNTTGRTEGKRNPMIEEKRENTGQIQCLLGFGPHTQGIKRRRAKKDETVPMNLGNNVNK